MLGASMAMRAPRTRGLGPMAMDAIRRNAGTLLLPGAATPVLGPELCTDGGFNVGVADWTAAGGVHTWTGSALRRAIGQGNAGSYRDFTVTPNAEYFVGGAILNAVGSGGLVINIYGGGGFTGLLASLPATGYAFVRPTTSTLRIYFYTDNTRGADLDDVTVRLFSGYTHGNPALRNYLDSAGTDILDSVTQVDQPVGLALDSMGQVGPNVFSDASLVFGGETTRLSPGVYRIYSSAGAFSNLTQTGNGMQANKTYRLRFNVDSVASGSLAVDGPSGNVVPTVSAGVGMKECIITMGATASISIKRSSGVTDIQISNVTIEEIPGNHASQPTTASKPILRRTSGRYSWQFDGSNDSFSTAITTGNEGWVCSGVTFQSTAAQSLFGSGGNASSTPGVMLFLSAGAMRLACGSPTVSTTYVGGTAPAVGVPSVCSGGWGGGNALIGINNTEVSAALTDTIGTSVGTTFVGCSKSGFSNLNGSLSATVYCPTLPSPADRALIRRFVGSLQGQQL